MDMIKARNLTSHAYKSEVAEDIVKNILGRFHPALVAMERRFADLEKTEAGRISRSEWRRQGEFRMTNRKSPKCSTIRNPIVPRENQPRPGKQDENQGKLPLFIKDRESPGLRTSSLEVKTIQFRWAD